VGKYKVPISKPDYIGARRLELYCCVHRNGIQISLSVLHWLFGWVSFVTLTCMHWEYSFVAAFYWSQWSIMLGFWQVVYWFSFFHRQWTSPQITGGSGFELSKVESHSVDLDTIASSLFRFRYPWPFVGVTKIQHLLETNSKCPCPLDFLGLRERERTDLRGVWYCSPPRFSAPLYVFNQTVSAPRALFEENWWSYEST